MTMKKALFFFSIFSLLFVAGCQPPGGQHQFETIHVVERLVVDERSVPIYPRKAALTTDTARRFALDLPRRCTVDWDNQRVLSFLPEEQVEIIRLDVGDDLPRFNVDNFNFERLSVKDALERLLEGTGIRVIEVEPLPDRVSGTIRAGSLSDAVELIARLGRAYYSYDADMKELSISRRGKWLMRMPQDHGVVMALTDALRGANMRNLLINWQDRTMVLEGNHQTEREIRQIVADLGAQKYIIAWDMDIYRVYPRTENPIIWMNLLPAFGDKNIRMSIPGVVGRALVVSPEINTKTLQEFLARQANVVLISQGTFSIPNGWQSRFDIGQCSREERLETGLIVGATGRFGNFGGAKKIDARIALRTPAGEIASFSIPSSLGDNYVIIGIPTHSFVQTPETLISPFAELVIFMSPRVIQVVRQDQMPATPFLSGQGLRDFLGE